ncbi:MAG: efflux RND transporter periplasmic adaptor subunit [Pirellulales bacterium]|nr:efflux RND transporter periplasmic adaptor subunit [Pirellulales bacterium]
MKQILRTLLVLAIIGGSAAGGWYWWHTRQQPIRYRVDEITRGDLQATITATGTIEPEEVVDVGAQVAGKIKNLGADPSDSSKTIDYGSAVEEQTVLAQIDDAIYRTHVDQATATLAKAKADLLQLRARLHQKEREWHRSQTLATRDRSAISDTLLDTAQADYEAAKAALAVGEAVVAEAQATLNQAEVNLGYTTIRSPVKGVIIDRRVNVGQTVVANLNAPSLFLIAKDLKRLQVWAAVNEADVGQIFPSQRVTFSVDAQPDEVFEGHVAQTRLNATMTQNVVTYTVVVSTDNAAGKLLPYLTANLQFEVGRREQVPLVPNAALRWQPRTEQIDPAFRSSTADTAQAGAAAPDVAGDAARPRAKQQRNRGTAWVLAGQFVRPVGLDLGMSSATHTEIVGGELEVGAAVVVGEEVADTPAEAASPFAPQFRASKRPPG